MPPRATMPRLHTRRYAMPMFTLSYGALLMLRACARGASYGHDERATFERGYYGVTLMLIIQRERARWLRYAQSGDAEYAL